MSLNPRIREDRLRTAVSKLSKYYGLRTPEQDIIGIINRVRTGVATDVGITIPIAPAGTTTPTSEVVDPISQQIGTALDNIFNSTIGAYKAEDIARILNEKIDSANAEDRDQLIESFGKLIQIIGDGPQVRQVRRTFPQSPYTKLKYAGLAGTEQPIGVENPANSIPILILSPEERPPDAGGPVDADSGARTANCSIVLFNTPNLNISNRYTKPVSMFLNSVPPIEFAKAVPYMEVNFEFPISAIENESNRLLAPSLYKLILGGAVAPPNSLLYNLQTSNSSSNIIDDSNETNVRRNYTLMGMEVFTSPQTIFNQRTQKPDLESRYNRVLDPTRPILSIKQLTTSEVPSYSTYSYRTAQLQMTLHDRSRMADVASFFRADLRGNTRVDIEYGWIHPEGEKLSRDPNVSPYVDLINGMRKREKFQIRNSSFQFNDSGKVEITLELVTLGQSQMASEIVINDGDPARAAILRVNDLQETISGLIANTSLRNDGDGDRPTVSLQGIQVLEAASDAFRSGFELTSPQRRQLRTLINQLRTGRSGNVESYRDLANTLDDLWGDARTGRRGATADIESTLREQITSTIRDMIKYHKGRPPEPSGTGRRSRRSTDESGWPNDLPIGDPLVIRTNPEIVSTSGREGLPGLLGAGTSLTESTGPSWLRGEANLSNYSVSLATIMAHFVAKPLMKTGTYEEIQLMFYPFNENAGFANRINIGNFEVNLGMFAERLLDYRVNNASRSGNFTLTEFWSFITTNIINNYAASSYGLWEANSSLYRRPTARESRDSDDVNSWTVIAEGGDDVYNSRLSTLLIGITPTGEFRPPQLRMFTECLPVRNDIARGDARITGNVLRIHIYDQQMSSVVGLSELLMAERNRSLSINGRPRNPTPETATTDWASFRARLIEQAVSAGIIKNIGGTSATSQRYVIIGGSNRIKQFVMNNSPYIMPGTQHSLVKGVTLSSIQDEAASTLNLVNAPRPSEITAPNGEEPSGLPLQVIPVEMSMTTQGCPLLGFSGQFFIDLNTGTTADDLYTVNRIDSTLEEGSYRTNIKLRPISGFTRYRNYLNEIRGSVERLRELAGSDEGANAAAERTSSTSTDT